MKKVMRLIGIIALAAIIGFLFIACKDGPGNNIHSGISDDDDDDDDIIVTFNSNANDVRGTTPPMTVIPGETITLPGGSTNGGNSEGIYRTKYIFICWNTKADGTGDRYDAGQSFTPTGKTTLYAIWKEGFYVNFNLNGGNGEVPATMTTNTAGGWDNSGDNWIAPEIRMPYGVGFSREGYNFAGWSYDNKAAMPIQQPGSYAMITGHCTMYAAWTLADGYCSVTLNANGGNLDTYWVNGFAVSQGYIIDQPYQLPGADSGINRIGYVFNGWNTRADGTGTYYGNQFEPKIINSSITLYAIWRVRPYTVIFVNNRNNAVISTEEVPPGNSITLPMLVPYTDIIGWNTKSDGSGIQYQPGSSYKPTGNTENHITLYAQLEGLTPLSNVNGLSNKLLWLQAHAQNDTSYTIQVDTDESISPQILFPNDSYRRNITISLIGIGSNHTINLSSKGAMFTVNQDITLILGNNITLQGRSDNTKPLIVVQPYGTFTMNGGTICGNTSDGSGMNLIFYSGGGGVYVHTFGTFTMSGGTISGNSTYYTNSGGGGVYVYGGFTMSGGTISSNTAYSGGGVSVNSSGTFTMNGGTISSNTAYAYGGGVSVNFSGTFTMNNGTISGNTVNSKGGGVSVNSSGTFTMNNGTISGNTVNSNGDSYGGGVYAAGEFTMDGGIIFNKTGGTIYGYSNGMGNDNVVKDINGDVLNNMGHAVYIVITGSSLSGYKHRETTAGPTVNLYYSNGTFSGVWDN